MTAFGKPRSGGNDGAVCVSLRCMVVICSVYTRDSLPGISKWDSFSSGAGRLSVTCLVEQGLATIGVGVVAHLVFKY